MQAGIPCGPIYTYRSRLSPIRRCGISELRRACESPALGTINLVGQPFTLSRTPSKLVSGAPEYGEHTDGILAEMGYSANDISKWRRSGTI